MKVTILCITLAIIILATSITCNDDYSSINKKHLHPPELAQADFTTPTANFKAKKPNQPINVHVVAHTHDDVGWLKTVDEYYYGANNSIQDAGVQYIIDTVVQCLIANPVRRFTYVEIGFFYRWWNQQTDEMKNTVRGLVATGRLEFVNGGWSMNDEAATHYLSIIDQMTLGHQFLLREFGIKPTIGWHLDPFGHSNTMAALQGQFGFDAFFFARIDYEDYTARIGNKQLEWVWRPSKSLGKSVDVFTSAMVSYCTTPGDFDFGGGGIPIQDDPHLFDYNAKDRADTFANYIYYLNNIYVSGHILWPFGCDFAFSNAHRMFKNMDKLIKYFDAHPEYNLNVFYSTPETYVDAVYRAGVTWTVKTDDLFPYSDNSHSYWTGYFVSRGAYKAYERLSSSLLRSAHQLYTAALGDAQENTILAKINVLDEALGVAQHHDSITGTAKQHVNDDYCKRLSIGGDSAFDAMNTLLGKLITSSGPAPSFQVCKLLNQSICDVTEKFDSNVIAVLVHNPTPWQRNHHVQVPITNVNIKVYDDAARLQTSQVTSLGGNKYALVFIANLPPAGFKTYFLQKTSIDQKVSPLMKSNPNDDTVIQNQFFKLYFDQKSNLLNRIVSTSLKQDLAVDQNFYWYNSSTGNPFSGQTSGAYIFRPISSTPAMHSPSVTLTSTIGSLYQEVVQTFQNGISPLTQRFRLYNNASYIETITDIGIVNIKDGCGKEIITKFTIKNWATNGLFYTDSNGQEYQERLLNYRPTWNLTVTEPVAGNYYPVNIGAYIRDVSTKGQFTILTDRSMAGSSLGAGQLEIMLFRRTLRDDFRGVDEPLNETTPIHTRQLLFFDPSSQAAKNHRPHEQTFANQPTVFFAKTTSISSWVSQYRTQYSLLTKAFPPNLQLISIKNLQFFSAEVIIRLHHFYSVGEDADLSKPVQIDIASAFTDFDIVSVTETTLSANRKLTDLHRKQWKTVTSATDEPVAPKTPTKLINNAAIVTINPMEIKTLLVRLNRKTTH